MFVLLCPVMITMFVVTTSGVYWIFGFSLFTSAVIGACLTPTDPVLVASIVQGVFAEKYISKNVRMLLSAESAANDALGFFLLYLPFFLKDSESIGTSIGYWILKIALYQIMVSSLLGFLIGFCFGKLFKFASRHLKVEKESILLLAIAVTVI
jgi:NhaP-type Na+/H+ or K+/H+ antiporter